MLLDYVTFTGADDQTNIDDMLGLSIKYPFIEWGILVSQSSQLQEGISRFPSLSWQEKFKSAVISSSSYHNVSTHICGSWVRSLLKGDTNLEYLKSILIPCLGISQRIQFNTHGIKHIVHNKFFTDTFSFVRENLPNSTVIFQEDYENKNLYRIAKEFGIKTNVLFDVSYGTGITPEIWPAPNTDDYDGIRCGFAGGIGPDNVIQEINRIEQVCPSYYHTWIDMETKVRTESNFSLIKVEKICQEIKHTYFGY